MFGSGPLFDTVYQHHGCPFLGEHEVGLATEPRHWARMVAEGKWRVNRQEVMGEMEYYDQADIKEMADEFVIGMCWGLEKDTDQGWSE